MKKTRIAAAVIALTLMCVFGLYGCTGGPRGETGGDYDVNINPDKTTVVELIVTTTGSADERGIIEKLGDGFKNLYPNVTVKIDPLSGAIYDTMMGYYRADKMPDIFINNSFDMLTLGAAKVILDMTPYIDAETAAGTFNVNDYYEAFWKLGQKGFDGGQWMAPRAADQVVVHINKQKLLRAGVDLNPATTKVKNGWTWEDFLDVCEEVRQSYDAHGESNLYLADAFLNWEANFNAIFEANGVKYWGDGESSAINSENTRNALNMLKSLVDKRYVAKFSAPAQANFDGGQGAFMIHSRASSLSWSNLQNIYKSQLDSGALTMSDIYDVVSFPLIGSTPKVGAGIAGYSIASTIDPVKRDYAWQFLKFMMSRDGQNIIAAQGANYPPIRKDMADPKAEGSAWGDGFEALNLEAYTWAAQEAHNYVRPTDFILKRPAMANDLILTVRTMISSYVDYTGGDLNAKLNGVMQTCKDDLEYWAFSA
jgi:ABC-type glycerol-3-phosphate transport system substrate-binding protein